eukprot:SAG31_NODE_1361_length_8631_cov_3.401899_2_plen_165_part_00
MHSALVAMHQSCHCPKTTDQHHICFLCKRIASVLCQQVTFAIEHTFSRNFLSSNNVAACSKVVMRSGTEGSRGNGQPPDWGRGGGCGRLQPEGGFPVSDGNGGGICFPGIRITQSSSNLISVSCCSESMLCPALPTVEFRFLPEKVCSQAVAGPASAGARRSAA